MTEKARHDEHSDKRTPQASVVHRPVQEDDTNQRDEPAGGIKAVPQPSWDPFQHPGEPKVAHDRVTNETAHPVSRSEATMRSLRFPFEASPPDVTEQQLAGPVDDNSDR